VAHTAAAALTDGTIQLRSVTGNFDVQAAVGAAAAPRQAKCWAGVALLSQVAASASRAHTHPRPRSQTCASSEERDVMVSRGDDGRLLWSAPLHACARGGFASSRTPEHARVSPMQDLTGAPTPTAPRNRGI
jgi:hypothetical protein